MGADPKQVEQLFEQVVDLPGPEQARVLIEVKDAELRDAVESLLRMEVETEAVRAPAKALARELDDDLVGQTLGVYTIHKCLGSGGFGVVYQATQLEPIRRPVALKILQRGTNAEFGRFEAERQALALMDHPCIAKIFDAGTFEGGRHYFAMELVKGEPITDHCDRHKLGLPERLDLFRQVCDAVQHAHQKGVIHRDLKPGNILVASDSKKALPKVIDFGIAKAIGSPLTPNAVVTLPGIIGTPTYMAPEQAERSNRDIDTRADVYSLGVVLYELLTGQLPFSMAELEDAAQGGIRQVLSEIDPPKPSTRLQALLDGVDAQRKTATSIGTSRATDARSLFRQVKGDLDWIVMRCLAKDRDRRYAAASDIADEIGKFLRYEAVDAGPESVWYRSRKMIRRHRFGVVIASALALSAAVGLVALDQGERAAREVVRALNADWEVALGKIGDDDRWVGGPKVSNAVISLRADVALVDDANRRGKSRLERDLRGEALARLETVEELQGHELYRYEELIRTSSGQQDQASTVRSFENIQSYLSHPESPVDPARYVAAVGFVDLSSYLAEQMIPIEGGVYTMGMTPDREGELSYDRAPDIPSQSFADEKPPHDRTVADFAISRTEVTVAQFVALMDHTPLNARDRMDEPIASVTWYDAVEFCNRLSEHLGLSPRYELTDIRRREDDKRIRQATFRTIDGNGFRLPTEAEWEYAARAGSDRLLGFPWDTPREGADMLGKRAHFRDSFVSEITAEPVAQRDANGFGLYGMFGNVSEWCEDIRPYKFGEAGLHPDRPNRWADLEPAGVDLATVKVWYRSIRGGSYQSNWYDCRPSGRAYLEPTMYAHHIGFRVVLDN